MELYQWILAVIGYLLVMVLILRTFGRGEKFFSLEECICLLVWPLSGTLIGLAFFFVWLLAFIACVGVKDEQAFAISDDPEEDLPEPPRGGTGEL
ncbi:hypothetical protein DRO66_00585 [Candidatus Bathyarchaeota archaeon]|nr:MAG: hypothetical protein DRO66_00585 [Candidatus Bathyarchaeota archaeon]